MNWDATGAIADIIGAAAVVITLAYLAVQIRQNTKAVRASALDASITSFNGDRRSIYESSELTQIYIRGMENHENLSEDEILRFRLLMHNNIWCVWNIYSQTEFAGLSRGTWEAQKSLIVRTLSAPGGAWFWRTYKHEFEGSFEKEIDRVLHEST